MEINTLGYRTFYARHNAAAAKVFELNTNERPASSNAFHSLTDGDRVLEDLKFSEANYQRALDLDATNEHARAPLEQIK